MLRSIEVFFPVIRLFLFLFRPDRHATTGIPYSAGFFLPQDASGSLYGRQTVGQEKYFKNYNIVIYLHLFALPGREAKATYSRLKSAEWASCRRVVKS
jgi:hypothetical protein